MTYRVTRLFTVKTKLGDITLNPGQVITLAEEKAVKLITEGKIKPIGAPKHDTLNNLLSYFEEKGKIRLIDESKQQPEPQKVKNNESTESEFLKERMAIEGENCSPEQKNRLNLLLPLSGCWLSHITATKNIITGKRAVKAFAIP